MSEVDMTGKKYNHGEAFMLMQYRCKDCGHNEIIWNSRDGVTPFGLGCPSCGGMFLQHENWRQDRRAPDHRPHKWQRFFRDGTPDEAANIMKRRIDMMRGSYPLSPEEENRLIQESRDYIGGEFQEGWPSIDINLPPK